MASYNGPEIPAPPSEAYYDCLDYLVEQDLENRRDDDEDDYEDEEEEGFIFIF